MTVLRILALVVALQCASTATGNYFSYKPKEAFLSWWSPSGHSLSPHIVGGREAKRHSHPHQVAFLATLISPWLDFMDTAFCGGSLISDLWVLTAAHCVDKEALLKHFKLPSRIISRFQLKGTAVLGAHNYTDVNGIGVQSVQVSEIFKHPEWSMLFQLNDIALLKLEHRVTLDGKYIRAIRLPKLSQQNESFYGSEVTMTGWGSANRSNEKRPDLLRSVDSNVVGIFYCKFRYLFLLVSDTNICVSGWGLKGTCHGDSGGPLIVKESDGEPTLIGITAFGFGCSWGFPPVFTKVSSYLDWIYLKTRVKLRN